MCPGKQRFWKGAEGHREATHQYSSLVQGVTTVVQIRYQQVGRGKRCYFDTWPRSDEK